MAKERNIGQTQEADIPALSLTEVGDILYHAHDTGYPHVDDPQAVRELLANVETERNGLLNSKITIQMEQE